MISFRLFCLNHDGCHMWSRKCSLFPEHRSLLALGSSCFDSFAIYIHYILLNLPVLGLCLWNNDSGLLAWISVAALSLTYFIILYMTLISP